MVSTITPRVGTVTASGAVQGMGMGIIQVTDVAGTNAITANSSPEISEYIENQLFLIRPANANTGAVTVDINTVGELDWVKPNGDDLENGDLSPNLEYLVKYDGTELVTIAPGF